MPVDDRMRAQAQLILDSHPAAATHPAADQWDDADNIEYFYRAYAILVREPDVTRVVEALGVIFDDVGYGDVPEGEREIQARISHQRACPPDGARCPRRWCRTWSRCLDDAVGPGVARPEHKVYVCPWTCPATEPLEVPSGVTPSRRPAWTQAAGAASPGPATTGRACPSSSWTPGLIPQVAADHPWLAGVDGAEEDPYAADGTIVPYAGHGTFVAGVLRCVAPKASVFVERAFDIAGADYRDEARVQPGGRP